MSIHSSLRAAGKGKGHRSVLKRHERLKVLKEKNLWDDGKNVLGIPKVKMQKMRVKKEKATPAEGAPAAGQAAAAPGAETPAAKPAAAQAKTDKK